MDWIIWRFLFLIPLLNWTVLKFNYESDPKKQDANREATRINNGGLRGSRASGMDAHEVAYAMTKQGGVNSNTIMRLVPSGENRSHGKKVQLALEAAGAKDGDPLFIVLIPESKKSSPVSPVDEKSTKPNRRHTPVFVPDPNYRRKPYAGYPGQSLEPLIRKLFGIDVIPVAVPVAAPVIIQINSGYLMNLIY